MNDITVLITYVNDGFWYKTAMISYDKEYNNNR